MIIAVSQVVLSCCAVAAAFTEFIQIYFKSADGLRVIAIDILAFSGGSFGGGSFGGGGAGSRF
jgi:uncharacterized membrane protein